MDLYTHKLNEICELINTECDPDAIDLSAFPSIAFGIETALLDLKAKGSKILFQNDFSQSEKGIPINGLVWMGDKAFMQKQIREKIKNGYHCIKLKIAALDFNTELEILADIRKQFSPKDIEIRLDANGAFHATEALEKLEKLAKFEIHSIEQPIRQGQSNEMAELCMQSPIPIVLDEELIGIAPADREQLLEKIKPAYIILKPSLLGGFNTCENWIRLAKTHNIDWWITSALESNIGLNAIAQWTYTLNSPLPQGLGTGQLYHNNIPSPLQIENAQLFYNPKEQWDLNTLSL
jgi:o-succinylbenzoate synthase